MFEPATVRFCPTATIAHAQWYAPSEDYNRFAPAESRRIRSQTPFNGCEPWSLARIRLIGIHSQGVLSPFNVRRSRYLR